jgi:hypothetical protein
MENYVPIVAIAPDFAESLRVLSERNRNSFTNSTTVELFSPLKLIELGSLIRTVRVPPLCLEKSSSALVAAVAPKIRPRPGRWLATPKEK